MRNSNQGKPLPPLDPLIPIGKAIELGSTDAAYTAWDSAWSAFHDDPADKAALALAEAV